MSDTKVAPSPPEDSPPPIPPPNQPSDTMTALKSVIRESVSSSAKRRYRVRRPKDTSGDLQHDPKKDKTVYTLAKKFVKPQDDGNPLPGSLEEDLTATPETFFEAVPNRESPLTLRSSRPGSQWGRLGSAEMTRRPEHLVQQQQQIHNQLTQEKADPLSVRFKGKKSVASQDAASSKDVSGKVRMASKRNLKKIEMPDADIEQKYAETMTRLRNNPARTLLSTAGGARSAAAIQAFRSTNQERFFDHHKQIQTKWDRQLNSACSKLGRQAADSVVTRADGYREKVEKVTALEMATPSELKYGTQNWYMSLRGSNLFKDSKHYAVHVGNSYTGLWMQITDNPNKQAEIIRKPTRMQGSYKTFKDSPFLQDKIRREAKRLNEIIPVKDDQIEGLQVVGISALNVEYNGFKDCAKPKTIELNGFDDDLQESEDLLQQIS